MSKNTCANCKWSVDEVCTNSDSKYCADYPIFEFECNVFEQMTEDDERYRYVLNNIEDNLLHTRWSKETLIKHLKDTYDIYKIKDMREDSTGVDYNYNVSINKDWGYFDLYYLISPFVNENDMYITEIYIYQKNKENK